MSRGGEPSSPSACKSNTTSLLVRVQRRTFGREGRRGAKRIGLLGVMVKVTNGHMRCGFVRLVATPHSRSVLFDDSDLVGHGVALRENGLRSLVGAPALGTFRL